ncbi:MAG TPA: lysozyme inhibitor LprI family protein [Tahibacter sp.]|uniref:lysozyme inhibitor LprI family protein n=1 Tax=Tahibacter sp. TaxID=2056211 RepID=UPI002C1A28B6|nr:lysozyme inhibitor LprI family protein [Tahibacter sp.]HSX62186.1 lysozyme inhibitor LprI family protein [Tahibacter sp.]
MKRTMRLLFAGTVYGICAGAGAQDFGDNPACDALGKIAIPKADEPDAAARTRLAGCDSEKLYYAHGATPDYADARRCAFLERENGDELVFGGSAVLMMIYANGDGVPRNIALAKQFACAVQGAPAELDGRLQHLDELAKAGGKTERFDLCDDITSGYMMGFCADHAADAAEVGRDRRVAALTASWSADHRAALAPLRAAADAYFDAVVDGEVDMSGTARGAMAVGARESLENAFVESLTAFEQGRFPDGDAAAFAAADKALNAAYAATIKRYKSDSAEGIAGTVTPDGIRNAERAWIKYRDAWGAFGAKKYPAVSADAWRAYFTREREKALKELAGE